MEFSYNFGEIGSLVILEVIYLGGSESTSPQPTAVGYGLIQLPDGRYRLVVRHERTLGIPLLLAADGG